jgi:L-idonate 5-dehydrogenase
VGGWCRWVACVGQPAPGTIGDLLTREITWIGSYRIVEAITEALQAMGGGPDVFPLITHAFDLADPEQDMPAAANPVGTSKVYRASRPACHLEEPRDT